MKGAEKHVKSNHLGNVLSVVSDVKIPVDENEDSEVDFWVSDVLVAQDYSPYGALLYDRKFNSDIPRYGMGGHEKDREVIGDWYDFGGYGYDPRVGPGGRGNPDPVMKPYESPYTVFANKPMIYVDPEGTVEYLTVIVHNEKTGESAIETKAISNDLFPGKLETRNDIVGGQYRNWHDKHHTFEYVINENGERTLVKQETKLLTEVQSRTSGPFLNSMWGANFVKGWVDTDQEIQDINNYMIEVSDRGGEWNVFIEGDLRPREYSPDYAPTEKKRKETNEGYDYTKGGDARVMSVEESMKTKLMKGDSTDRDILKDGLPTGKVQRKLDEKD